MGKTYKVRSIIICDDIREENTGKEILIGVYRRVILLGQIPALLVRLFIRVDIEVQAEISGPLCCKVLSPSGEQVARIDAIVTSENPLIVVEGTATLNFQFAPMPFKVPGTYKICLGIGRPAKQIGNFVVRSQAAQAELQVAPVERGELQAPIEIAWIEPKKRTKPKSPRRAAKKQR